MIHYGDTPQKQNRIYFFYRIQKRTSIALAVAGRLNVRHCFLRGGSLPRIYASKSLMKSLSLIASLLLLACAALNESEPALFGASNPSTAAEDAQFFQDKVRPILAEKCYPCHTDTATSQLRLDSREALLKGGSRGPAIVPGEPDKSLLIEAVRQTGGLKRPMGRQLAQQQVADLVAWVRMGAPWGPAEHAESMDSAPTAANTTSSTGQELF